MRKAKLSLSTFGIILGIAGIEHGIGEFLQGSIKVGTHFFESWPNNELYEILAGEPAFSLFTELTFTTLGILAIIVSSMLILCSIFLIDKRFGSFMFLILNICMFLFGAGFAGPIIMGIPIATFSTLLRNLNNERSRSDVSKKIIRISFFSFYFLSILSWFLMWPGFVLISYFYGFPSGTEIIVYIVACISLTSFIVTVILGMLYDRTDWLVNISSNNNV